MDIKNNLNQTQNIPQAMPQTPVPKQETGIFDSIEEVYANKPSRALTLTHADGKVETFAETETQGIFSKLESPDKELSLFDESNKVLISEGDAKKYVQSTIKKAIEIIKAKAPLFAKQGYGPDFAKELEGLGESNIELKKTGLLNNQSLAESQYNEQKTDNSRGYAMSMNNQRSQSKIFIHYNHSGIYNSTPEEMATTIVHELGHLSDKDNIDSIQEERDLETKARNFKAFIADPNNFKYNPNPEGIEEFLDLYRNNKYRKYNETSPKHGE